MMGRYPHFRGRPGPVDERIVDEMMSLFEVSEFETRNYQTLSGGERQRVNFARVLAQLWPVHAEAQPAATRFLFLDEPLTFLDIKHQIDFMKRLREFTAAPDVVTVGVVHDLNLAAKFADQIVVIDAGKIVAAGTPTAVLTPSLIKNVFGIEPTVVSSGSGMQLVFE
jgi:iron complex transport system ATP-binding protein